MTGSRQLLVALVIALASSGGSAEERSLLLLSTTSTENSGLLDYLLPKFHEATGIKVYVVAKGTGQTLRAGERGDGDVLLVHARDAEESFVAKGYGVSRSDVMYNDFVIVGPSGDPLEIRDASTAAAALARLSSGDAIFTSRGDDSGTHKKELQLWQAAGIDPAGASGTWYREVGAGMGATLNAAIAMNAYTLTDRATWISFKGKGDFEIHYEGDAALFNPYGIILVNPERHKNVKADLGRELIAWLTAQEGQDLIASFEIEGQQLFYPNAGGSPSAGAAAARGGSNPTP